MAPAETPLPPPGGVHPADPVVSVSAQIKKLHDQHRMFTVQVNGNDKPAWLFDHLPCLP